MNNVRQIRRVIYSLKKTLGFPVSILVLASIDQDLQTGEIDHSDRVINIRRAVIATAKEVRDFAYDLSFIAANKNFTYGGFFDISQRIMILDGKDLPSDYSPSINDRCVYDNHRWEFRILNPTAANVGWIIQLQHLDSQETENTIEETVINNVPVSDPQPWLQ